MKVHVLLAALLACGGCAIAPPTQTRELEPERQRFAVIDLADDCSEGSVETVTIAGIFEGFGCSRESAIDDCFDAISREIEALRNTRCADRDCGEGNICGLVYPLKEADVLEDKMILYRVRLPGCANGMGWSASMFAMNMDTNAPTGMRVQTRCKCMPETL